MLPSYETTSFLSLLSIWGVSGALMVNPESFCRMFGLPYADYNYPTPWEAVGIVGRQRMEAAVNWAVSLMFYAFLAKSMESPAGATSVKLATLGSCLAPLCFFYLVTYFGCTQVAKLRFRGTASNVMRSITQLPLAFFMSAMFLLWYLGYSVSWVALFIIMHLVSLALFSAALHPPKIVADGAEEGSVSSGWTPILWFGPLGFLFVPAISIIAALIIGTLVVDVSWRWVWKHTPHSIKRPLVKSWHGLISTLATIMMRDAKYRAYLPTHLAMLMVPVLFAYCLYYEVRNGDSFSVVHAVFYHLVRMGPYFVLFSNVHTLVHSEAHDHNKWFKPHFSFMNRSLEWFLFMFYGGVPENYSVGHNKIHHTYTNRYDDVHSNLEYTRTSPRQFLDYLIKFALYWSGVSVVWHMRSRKEHRLANRQLIGMAVFYSIMAVLLLIDWKFALLYFVFPYCEAILLLGAVSYTWHAWFEPDDLDNEYVNSVTIIDGEYNVFNQDYHVVHHQDPSVWWEDAPKRYEMEMAKYKASKATVFRKTQAFELFFLILFGNFERMADLFVDVSGTMSRAEIITLLKRRLGPIRDRSVLKRD